ncbi:MAG TPA: RDD family protein [Gammaproteobacteria bacterium]|nr:RDD family protein [Gammaproteobacteria bacterium]
MQSTISPYTPPGSPTDPGEPEPLEVVPARKGLRLSNCVTDGLLVLGLTIIIYVLLRLVVGIVLGASGIKYIAAIPMPYMGLAVYVGYYTLLESLTGRTVGKWMTGTMVVNVRGTKASFMQVLGRSLSRLVPFEFVTFLGEDGRGLHDRLARTYVVRCR